MLTFFYRRPFKISLIKIYDKTHNLNYSTFTYRPKTEVLVRPAASLSKEVPFGSLLACYREGMNSLDLAYRYISFFKIYEAWYRKDFAFKLTDNVLRKKMRPDFTVTKKLLLGSYNIIHHKKFVTIQHSAKNIAKFQSNHL